MTEEQHQKAQKLLTYAKDKDLAMWDELQEIVGLLRVIAEKEMPEHKCPEMPEIPPMPEMDMSETNKLLKELCEKEMPKMPEIPKVDLSKMEKLMERMMEHMMEEKEPEDITISLKIV